MVVVGGGDGGVSGGGAWYIAGRVLSPKATGPVLEARPVVDDRTRSVTMAGGRAEGDEDGQRRKEPWPSEEGQRLGESGWLPGWYFSEGRLTFPAAAYSLT